MSYPIIRADGDEVDVKLNQFNSMNMDRKSARLLATRLVEVVGCEQVDAERKRNEELAGLLREQLIRARMCHICEQFPCKPDCRLRAALEGR